MNTLGSLLVHIDESQRSEARLQLARSLAAQCGSGTDAVSAVNALYGTMPSYQDMPFAFAEGAAISLPLLQKLDAQRRAEVKKLFDRVNASATPPMRWRELDGEPLISGMTRHALLADLLVFGQYDPNDLQTGAVPSDFVESVLIASGKPALVIPYAGSFTALGRDVLVAWKPTRETARAVSAAIPLLQRAQRIHLVAETRDDHGPSGDNALETYLRSHGVQAKIERHAAVPAESPGESLLSRAADFGADLLVMGCYGHSRARELVLGGASRTILRSMTLPVLMAH